MHPEPPRGRHDRSSWGRARPQHKKETKTSKTQTTATARYSKPRPDATPTPPNDKGVDATVLNQIPEVLRGHGPHRHRLGSSLYRHRVEHLGSAPAKHKPARTTRLRRIGVRVVHGRRLAMVRRRFSFIGFDWIPGVASAASTAAGGDEFTPKLVSGGAGSRKLPCEIPTVEAAREP